MYEVKIPRKTAIGSQSGIDQSLHKPLLIEKKLNILYITLSVIMSLYIVTDKGVDNIHELFRNHII